MRTPALLSARDLPDAAALERFSALVEEAAMVDGSRAFNDQSMLTLGRDGGPQLIEAERGGVLVGAAALGSGEAEFVVAPAHRCGGIGTAILAHLLERSPRSLAVWAHGDSPGAAALARNFRLNRSRSLLKLRARTPERPSPWTRTDFTLSAFQANRDAEDWISLNARAFASHPEQGRQTRADLSARIAEPWFEADDFLLVRENTGTLAGFCWLKVHEGEGEIYVLGVDPSRTGAGVGRSLLAAGLDRLRERGLTEATLFVEADNGPAVRLYRSAGFEDVSVDVQYRRA